MSEWEQQFAAIKQQFFQRTRQRLQATEVLIKALATDPGDDGFWQQVCKDFHFLSGAGGTYRMPELTELGAAGEELCLTQLELPAERRAHSEVSRLQLLLEQARALIESDS
jgi:chemotaxis protein histidine kinase CheA